MNDLKMYEEILGKPIKLGHLYKSPFRLEKRASLSFFRNKNGHIKWKDFGSSEPAGNIYDFVSKHIGSKEIDKIRAYMARSDSFDNTRMVMKYVPKKELKLEIKTKQWEKKEIEYWEQFGLDKTTLKKFNVYPLKHYYINDIKTENSNELMFAEIVNDHVKIYRPLSKEMKWKSNVKKEDVFGLEQLNKESKRTLIITKSLKDVMVLNKMGYNAISPQSETSDLPTSIKETLNKYENLYVFFDNDETGVRRGKEMAERYNAKSILIPIEEYGSKDISDLVRDHGMKKAKEFLEKSTKG